MISHTSQLWNFLSESQRILADDGAFLYEDSARHTDQEPTDYSYLVFPFAKLFEGFLKDMFLHLDIISPRDYHSDHFRIGKVLSPMLVHRLGKRSAYTAVYQRYGVELADVLWQAWKEGRNLVFHYFPHNYRSLTRDQAKGEIDLLIYAMTETVMVTGVRR